MSLSSYKLNVSIAVTDMGRARGFYEGKLGLSVGRGSGLTAAVSMRPEARPPSTSTRLPAHAGGSTATLATWYVDDVDRVVDELSSGGVTFERYEGLTADEKGISPRAGGGKVAWFKDPDGNTFAVEGP